MAQFYETRIGKASDGSRVGDNGRRWVVQHYIPPFTAIQIMQSGYDDKKIVPVTETPGEIIPVRGNWLCYCRHSPVLGFRFVL